MTRDELERAALWHSRLEDASDGPSRGASEAGFNAWHGMRDDHRRAFAAVAAADAVARELGDEPALRDLGDEALARATAQGRRGPRWGVAALVTALVVLPVAALTIRHVVAPAGHPASAIAPSRVFSTAIGQQRLVTLGEGTQVLLDTASHVAIDGATLTVRGQAAVTAGRSPVGLTVRNAHVVIRVGTLNVRVEGDRAELLAQSRNTVAIIDGVAMKPDDLLSLVEGKSRAARATDPGAITGWQTGWLQFNDVPLTSAVREFNRYRRIPIRVVGEAGSLRISGSFRPGADQAFLDLVDATLPVTIDRAGTAPTIVVSHAAK